MQCGGSVVGVHQSHRIRSHPRATPGKVRTFAGDDVEGFPSLCKTVETGRHPWWEHWKKKPPWWLRVNFSQILDREFTFCFFLKTSGLKNICYFFAPLKQCNIFQGDSQVVCFQARLYCQWILPLLALQFTSPIPVLGSLNFVYQPPRPTSSFLPNLLLLSTWYPFFQ